jgi:hypothetical protein
VVGLCGHEKAWGNTCDSSKRLDKTKNAKN